MKHLLQRPHEDELLSSVWVRTVRRTGLPVRSVARALTGRKWAPGFFQVAHVTELAPTLQVDPMTLLWEHTVFPYATAYFEQHIFDAALGAALAKGSAAFGMGAVTQSVSDLVRFRRFCTACAREDAGRWGESYWRRSHNLPGVLVCLRHGFVLHESEIHTTGPNVWDLRLPDELSGTRMLHRPLSPFDREMTTRSVTLLGRDRETQLKHDPDWYRAELIARGLLTQSRQVSAERLTQWARGLAGVSRLRYGLLDRQTDLRWLALMVRPNSSHPVIPLKHLMFETALALNGQAAAPVLDHVPPGPSGRPADALDRQYAAAVRKVVDGYVKRGEKVRIEDALTVAGCWSAFRHAQSALPRTVREVKRLRASVASKRPGGRRRATTA